MLYGVISEDPSFFTLYSMNITNGNKLPTCIAKIGQLLLRLPNIISIVEGGDLEGVAKDIVVSPKDFNCTSENGQTQIGKETILNHIQELFYTPTTGSDFRIVGVKEEQGNFPSEPEIDSLVKISSKYIYVLVKGERTLLPAFTKNRDTFILCAYKYKTGNVVCRVRDDFDNISFWEFDRDDATIRREMTAMPNPSRVTDALYVKEIRIDSILNARKPLFEQAIDKIESKMKTFTEPSEYRIIRHSKSSKHELDHHQCLVTAFVLAKYCGVGEPATDVYKKIPDLRARTARAMGFTVPTTGNDAQLSPEGQYVSFLQRKDPYKVFEAIAKIEKCNIHLFTAMIPTFEKIEPIKKFGYGGASIFLGYIPPSPPYWVSAHFIPYVDCSVESINFKDADAVTQGTDLKRIFSRVQPSLIETIDNKVSTVFSKTAHRIAQFFTLPAVLS
jgi:hypothetical protein